MFGELESWGIASCRGTNRSMLRLKPWGLAECLTLVAGVFVSERRAMGRDDEAC